MVLVCFLLLTSTLTWLGGGVKATEELRNTLRAPEIQLRSLLLDSSQLPAKLLHNMEILYPGALTIC
ncbi:hypothetical protein NQZ68_019101 [Dissostichus eleginoides]|nr:hypothetical protein NQZ68_019101 [Dissostichus eleginoides]